MWAKTAYMKSILVISSALILSMASFFTQSDINVTFDMPSEIVAGESFILNLDVDKGDISNFAKLQLELPEGFSAELYDGKSGTFTFYDQKMKLIWLSLPSDPKFQVKVKINTTKTLNGVFNFNGKISFVIKGERKSKELISSKLSVSPSASAIETVKTANLSTPTDTTETSINIGSKETEIFCSRNFDAKQVAPGGTFLVEIKINKTNISGFGKIVENIPEGFTAQEIESNGALFSQKGNEIKFLWMTLPADDEFTVSYKIMVNENSTGIKVIDGKMSFLEGSEKKSSLIDGSSIEINSTPKTDIPQTVNIENKPPIEENNPKKEDEKPLVQDSNPIEESSILVQDKSTENIDPISTYNNISSNQVNYRVQICALRKKVATDYFVKKHNVKETIYADMHEGWHKYTVGDYKKYMDARKQKDITAKNYKINGTFVTAYNSGTRITVQEALMITKDEWIAP